MSSDLIHIMCTKVLNTFLIMASRKAQNDVVSLQCKTKKHEQRTHSFLEQWLDAGH